MTARRHGRKSIEVDHTAHQVLGYYRRIARHTITTRCFMATYKGECFCGVVHVEVISEGVPLAIAAQWWCGPPSCLAHAVNSRLLG
jgi:hypothetical protein